MKPTATLGGGQMKVTVFMIIVGIIFLCIFVGLLTLIVRALLKYIHSKDVRQEKSVVRKSLGEALKAHRTQCKMTQEFVAETIGVSRQAVSKWENGVSHRKRYHTKHNNTTLIRDLAHPKRTYRNPP